MAPNSGNGYDVDPAGEYFTTDSATNHSKRAALVMLLVGGMTFGSFLWLRMRLVSDMPRQAYADPEAAQAAQQPSSERPAPPEPHNPASAAPSSSIPLDEQNAKPYSVNDASGGPN